MEPPQHLTSGYYLFVFVKLVGLLMFVLVLIVYMQIITYLL